MRIKEGKSIGKGNSLVVAEKDGLFYMFQDDITYIDEALYENRLSIVFEDFPDDWRCPRCKQPKDKFTPA